MTLDPADSAAEVSITLTNNEWAEVMHSIIIVASLHPDHPLALPSLRATGVKLADQCPAGSAPWFGAAGLR